MGAGRKRRGRPRARASGELGGRRRNGNFVVVVVETISSWGLGNLACRLRNLSSFVLLRPAVTAGDVSVMTWQII